MNKVAKEDISRSDRVLTVYVHNIHKVFEQAVINLGSAGSIAFTQGVSALTPRTIENKCKKVLRRRGAAEKSVKKWFSECKWSNRDNKKHSYSTRALQAQFPDSGLGLLRRIVAERLTAQPSFTKFTHLYAPHTMREIDISGR